MNTASQQAVRIRCDYQPEVDLLYAWIGEAEPAQNIEVEEGIYVRVSPRTRRVIGIEVLDCASRFHQDPTAVDATFAESLIERYKAAALEEFDKTNPPTLFASEQ